VPGALTEVTRLLGTINANIIEISHQRAFTHLSLKLAEVEFILQTLGRDHMCQILDIFTNAKYDVSFSDTEVRKTKT
jgi:threonine dehydratase